MFGISGRNTIVKIYVYLMALKKSLAIQVTNKKCIISAGVS